MNSEIKVPKIINRILKKRVSPNFIQIFFRLSEVSSLTLNKELTNFQKDIDKYRSGVLLWVRDCYPNVVLMYSLLGVDLSNLKVGPNMKEVVDEYYTFIRDVRERNPVLFNMELIESKSFFGGEMQPIKFATKDLLINSLDSRITKIMQILSPQIKKYAEKLIIEIEHLFKNSTLKSILNLPIFITKIKRFQKETMPSLNDISDDVNIIIDDFKRICNENTSIAYLELNLIKNIDSFNVNFTKFFARLFSILLLSKGDERIKHESYLLYNPDSRDYNFNTRKNLKIFLDQYMKSRYPKLSNYIRDMFNYNIFRIIESHRNPLVRIAGGFAYFSNPGKNDLYMNLSKIMRVTKTYNFFIDSLGLY